MKFHMLFEQSGTFKNVFKEYGHEAWDYDVLNDYGQTDYIIDLFREIDIEYLNVIDNRRYKTIFRDMKPETDFIFAFFPCVYFTDLNELQFRLIKSRSEPVFDKQNVERVLNRIQERERYFTLWNKFCFICQSKGIRTIIENPIGNNRRNYLKLYSAWQPSYDELDRTKFGDCFKKPTHFFAINFEMKENFQMFDKEYFGLKQIQNCKEKDRQRERSEITPRYADNFYKRFLEGKV